MPEISLVISFYNRIDYLRLIFAALEKQTFRDFEIIIADDGSSETNTAELEEMIAGTAYSLRHLWQEDKGFRKNRILNRAIASSASDYLVFIDGDCIPHPEFMKEHAAGREDNVALTGRRVNLSKELSGILTEKNISEGYPEKLLLRIFADSITGGSKDAEKGLYVRNRFLRRFLNKKERGILGCNFSAARKDLLEVNGFDERYIAPSVGEDSDIEFRLRLNGVKIKPVNNAAVQYHLYHELQPRPQKNIDLFNEVKREGKAFTDYGLVKK
jgi:glycosyltransferase involved in cell wall biosynthesis